jgi:hypothetical protein
MARLEAPLGAANVLVDPSMKTSRERLYIARTLVGARTRVPVRNMNVVNKDQDQVKKSRGQIRLTTKNNSRDRREISVSN